MEANKYRSVTPLRKKRKKITMTAALILCLVFFVVGIACGRSVSSGKQEKEANAKIQKLEMDYNETLSAQQEKIDTLEKLLNEKKGELAETKKQISDINKAQEEKVEAKEETSSEDEPTKVQEEKEEKKQPKGTSSVLRKLIIICLVVIIIVCILFALTILIKKHDDDEEDDEEDDDEDYYEEDDEEYYDDEEIEEDNE